MKPWYLSYGRVEGETGHPIFVYTRLPITWKDILLVSLTFGAFWLSLAALIRQFTARRL